MSFVNDPENDGLLELGEILGLNGIIPVLLRAQDARGWPIEEISTACFLYNGCAMLDGKENVSNVKFILMVKVSQRSNQPFITHIPLKLNGGSYRVARPLG